MLARGIAATGRLFANDSRKSRRSERQERRREEEGGDEEDEQEAPPAELEEGIRVPRHVAFVMDGNGRW